MSDKTSAPEIRHELTAKQVGVTPDELTLIKQTIAVGATDAELKLFLYDCQRQGVHPLDKLIHFTKRSGKYTPITSIDFMRMRAADSGEYAGSDDIQFGDLLENRYPLTATCTVYRLVQGMRCAFTATARWEEYKPDQAFMWTKMPHTMLGKCAEALALRKGFPRQLAGLYAKEEMDQAGAEPKPERPKLTTAKAARKAPSPAVVDPPPSPDAGPGEGPVNPYTGEIYPPIALDEGWVYVWKYELDTYGWHHGWISTEEGQLEAGLQAKEVKTKRDIGLRLQDACTNRTPAKIRWNDRDYVTTIDLHGDPEVPF